MLLPSMAEVLGTTEGDAANGGGAATNYARHCYQQDLVFRIFCYGLQGYATYLFFLLQSICGFATMVQNYCYGVSDDRLHRSRSC
jgi:hypothetical protein